MNANVSADIIKTLYEKYFSYLKTRAAGIIHDRELCEDIVHDCIVKAILHRESLEKMNEAQQRKYLAVTVDNLAKNYASRNQHKYILYENISDKIFEAEKSAEDIAESRFQLESVLKTLEALNERDRNIILMKYAMLMPDRKIAPILGIKENSVRMTVRRSVFNLKKKLGIVKKYENIT